MQSNGLLLIAGSAGVWALGVVSVRWAQAEMVRRLPESWRTEPDWQADYDALATVRPGDVRWLISGRVAAWFAACMALTIAAAALDVSIGVALAGCLAFAIYETRAGYQRNMPEQLAVQESRELEAIPKNPALRRWYLTSILVWWLGFAALACSTGYALVHLLGGT